MDLLTMLNPGRWILPIALAAAVAVGVPLLKARYDAGQQRVGYERRAQEDRAAAEAQTARNRELQRASEIRYTVQAQARDRFFVTTVKEIHHATAHLAACPVGPDAVRLLNDARACADGGSPAACGPGDGMPRAR